MNAKIEEAKKNAIEEKKTKISSLLDDQIKAKQEMLTKISKQVKDAKTDAVKKSAEIAKVVDLVEAKASSATKAAAVAAKAEGTCPLAAKKDSSPSCPVAKASKALESAKAKLSEAKAAPCANRKEAN